VYFNVNFNVFFELIIVHLSVSELYIYQTVRCNDKKNSVHNLNDSIRQSTSLKADSF